MLSLQVHSGDTLNRLIPVLSSLRVQVFREWPYLYDGDERQEAEYLAGFAEAKDAVIVTAHEAGEVVGASTGCAFCDHQDGKKAPIEMAGVDRRDVFYCAESVLLPGLRGRGLGHRFFDARERHAVDRGYRYTAFCSVVRPSEHPHRPVDVRSLEPFWERRGYAKLTDVTAAFKWRDIGERAETAKTLQYWIKDLQ